jgi:hypothetical protein
LELKGEGQGFTLRGYTVVLKKPITRTTDVFKDRVPKFEERGKLSHSPLVGQLYDKCKEEFMTGIC